MPSNQSLPILLIVWRRPLETKRVLNRLRDLGAREIFVFGDGPRMTYPQDFGRIQAVRQAVQSEFPGVVERWSPAHLGLQEGVVSAITWFFSSVDRGLILEDDDLPTRASITFVRENLARFADVPEISQINCTSHAGELGLPSGPYFSYFHHTWGFGTWRDAWAGFSEFLGSGNPPTPAQLHEAVPGFGPKFYKHWSARVNREMVGQSDTFASSWNAFNFLRGTLALTPPASLVENIGFGPDASNSLKVPLIAGHPPRVADAKEELESTPELIESDRIRDSYVGSTQWNTQPAVLRIGFALMEWISRRARALRQWLGGRRYSGKSLEVGDPLTVAQRYYARAARRLSEHTGPNPQGVTTQTWK